MDNVPKETHVVSVMTNQPLETVAKVRDEKGDRLLLHPIGRQNRPTAKDKNPQRDQAAKRKALQTRAKFHADSNSAKTRHASADMLKHKESPTKDPRKVVRKDRMRYGRSLFCCVSQDSCPRKSTLREEGKLGSNHTVKFSKGTCHKITIRERKCPSRGIVQKCEPHGRSPCAPKFGERSHEDTLHHERCAHKAAWDSAKTCTSSRIRTKLRSVLKQR